MAADQILHTGGEGTVTMDGVDYGVTGWDATETVETAEVTSTKDYYPDDGPRGKTYKRSWAAKWSLSGSFKFNFDSSVNPFPAVEAGSFVALVLTMAYQGQNITCAKALVTSTPIANGGMNGVFEITINWESYGRYVKSGGA